MSKYKCKECGCQEFISSPNRYDIFEVIDEKIVLQKTEFTDDELILYCRDCSAKLEFDENDVKY